MADSPRFKTKDQFRAWKDRPETQAFLAYLREQRDLLADQWARGQEMDPRQQCKALLMGELSTLNWSDIEAAYAKAEEWAREAAAADAEPEEEEV